MSDHVYSDREMLLASSIAYLDVPPSLHIPGDPSSRKIGKIVDELMDYYGVQDGAGNWSLKPEFEGDKYLSDQFHTLKDITTLAGGFDGWREWTLLDTCDKNNSTGLYGCMIDTGDGNSIISFRGTESYSFDQKLRDQFGADLGLLNSSLTLQQRDAENYVHELWEKYGYRYNSFSLTGHSLGGNLAVHATITAPDAMKAQIDHTVSYDGPGFSNEYNRSHRRSIDEIKGKVDHYQWSMVGSLLYQPKTVRSRSIKAHDDAGSDSKLKNTVNRHYLTNVELDGDYVQDGEKDFLSQLLGPASKVVETAGPIILISIPYIGYGLYGLEMLNKVITYFVAVARESKNAIKDRAEDIRTFLLNIFDRYFFDSNNYEYRIDMSAIDWATDGLLDVASEAEKIAEEINAIAERIPFDSMSAFYYKSKIRGAANGVLQDLGRLRKCGKSGKEALRLYLNADRLVEESFY